MTNEKFSFKFVTKDQAREVIMNLDSSKATPIVDVSVDILKPTVDIHPPTMDSILNKRFNTYNLRNFQRSLRRKEKEPFGMALKPSVTVTLNSGPFCRKASKK